VVSFDRPEHRAVATALLAMDHDLLTTCACWFGDGTEIVLDLGEYRLSKDIDFLCADADGYREMRSLAVSRGAASLFGGDVREERAFRSDQYGIRGIVSVQDIPLRFEIVRESRIGLEGQPDRALGVPRLVLADRITEKLLANADRGQDRSTAYRDAIDLGMLALHRGPFPDTAMTKAEHAYGDDVVRKLEWVLARLADVDERRHASAALGMKPRLFEAAARTLLGEFLCLRPGLIATGAAPVPLHPRHTHLVDASLNGRWVAIRKRPLNGRVPGMLDNTMGPAVVFRGREIYCLDGVRFPNMPAWREALTARGAA
jgi:hypothetical protein